MSNQWSPDPNGLSQLIHIFTSLLNPDLSIRTAANDALMQATQIQDFDNYLLHILLTDSTNNNIGTRSSAGLYLKNDLMKNWHQKPQELKSHILTMLPHGLINPIHNIRRISSIIIASIFRKIGSQNWPNIIPNLMELLDGVAGINGQKGALEALALITEDSGRLLDREIILSDTNTTIRPMELMVPRLIQVLNDNTVNDEMKCQSCKCLVHCINIGSMVMQLNIDSLLSVMFNLCQNTQEEELQYQLSKLFCGILEQWPQKLYPNWDGIVRWIVHIVTSAQDEKVSLQACEFLLSMVTRETPTNLVGPLLNEILPVLLSKMVYSEEDVILMENEDARDQLVEDKDEDIKPQMAKGKEHTVGMKRDDGEDDGHNAHHNDSDDDDSDDDDDDDDDDDSDFNYTWNLRKCSAATVDVLSCQLPLETLNISFPIIKANMTSSEWPIREASILTLGAVAEASLEHASDQLPELIQFLIERIKDQEPRVRQIACWTLGRYSRWVCSQAQLNGAFANYFKPTFETILNCALDNQKVVQESSCSAIADFIENMDTNLLEELSEIILKHFQLYFQRYRRKNLIVLYDTVQTFVEKVGSSLRYKPDLIDLLLPPLIEKWQSLDDHDKDLWPLLECMSSVAASLGESFANYALPVYQRALRILHNCIEMDKMAKVQDGFEAPEKDFIVTSLDLIDGLVQGLSIHSAELIQHGDSQKSNYSLMELVLTCLDDSNDDVRQSGYALLGDLSIHLIDSMVKPYLQTIMMCINNEINGGDPSINIAPRNNAIWSLGEIVIRISSEEFSIYLTPMIQLILSVIHNLGKDEDDTLIENACITLGRMGVNNGELIMKTLSTDIIGVLNQWLTVMGKVDDNDEKISSFGGMMLIINQNPLLILNDAQLIQSLVRCIGEYQMPGEELSVLFYQLLNGIKTSLGEESWTQLTLITGVQGNIKMKYGI